MNKNAKLLNSLLSMGNKPVEKDKDKKKKVVKKKKKVAKKVASKNPFMGGF